MHQTLLKNATLTTHLQTCPSPPLVQQTRIASSYKPQCPPFPKWDGTPPTTPLFLAQVATYKSEAFYSGVQDWTRTTLENKHISVAISANMLASLPWSVSSMFLNGIRFASDGITMLSYLLTHLNPSSSENLLRAISYITRIEMGLGESSIDYMSHVRGISQRMQGVLMDQIIPFLSIAIPNHDRYPSMKSR